MVSLKFFGRDNKECKDLRKLRQRVLRNEQRGGIPRSHCPSPVFSLQAHEVVHIGHKDRISDYLEKLLSCKFDHSLSRYIYIYSVHCLSILVVIILCNIYICSDDVGSE